jgi:hypothetical protein
MPIAFDGFIEAECGNAIDLGEIPIQHDAHAPDRADHPVNLFDWNRRFRLLRHNNLKVTICDLESLVQLHPAFESAESIGNSHP